jgi:hypothetical protein
MSSPPKQPPPVTGPQAGPAKPAEPGPVEPPSIAASILPQRQEDAARHPEGEARPPEAVSLVDDITAAEQQAVETQPEPKTPGPKTPGPKTPETKRSGS